MRSNTRTRPLARIISVRWCLVWLHLLRVFLLLGGKLVRQFRGCGSPRRLSFILLPPAPNKLPSDDPEESEAGRKRCAPALQNPFRLEVGFGVEREHCLRSLRTRATSADPKPNQHEASRHAPRDRPAPPVVGHCLAAPHNPPPAWSLEQPSHRPRRSPSALGAPQQRRRA